MLCRHPTTYLRRVVFMSRSIGARHVMWSRTALAAVACGLLLILLAVVAIPQRAARAFSLEAHDAVLFAALPLGSSAPTDVDAGALGQIIGSFWTGTGNRGSDRFQADE